MELILPPPIKTKDKKHPIIYSEDVDDFYILSGQLKGIENQISRVYIYIRDV